MSAVQIYLMMSSVMFIALGVMLSGTSSIGSLLKVVSWVMAFFGTICTLASLDIVLSNGIRLI